MLPIIAATVTFLLLAAAGIFWALRRDVTHRTSGTRAGGGVDDGAAVGYGSAMASEPGGGD